MDFNKRSGICITIPPVFQGFLFGCMAGSPADAGIYLNQKWGISLRLIPDR